MRARGDDAFRPAQLHAGRTADHLLRRLLGDTRARRHVRLAGGSDSRPSPQPAQALRIAHRRRAVGNVSAQVPYLARLARSAAGTRSAAAARPLFPGTAYLAGRLLASPTMPQGDRGHAGERRPRRTRGHARTPPRRPGRRDRPGLTAVRDRRRALASASAAGSGRPSPRLLEPSRGWSGAIELPLQPPGAARRPAGRRRPRPESRPGGRPSSFPSCSSWPATPARPAPRPAAAPAAAGSPDAYGQPARASQRPGSAPAHRHWFSPGDRRRRGRRRPGSVCDGGRHQHGSAAATPGSGSPAGRSAGPGPSGSRRPRPGGPEPARVSIGTIEVTVVPPARPAPREPPRRASTARPGPALPPCSPPRREPAGCGTGCAAGTGSRRAEAACDDTRPVRGDRLADRAGEEPVDDGADLDGGGRRPAGADVHAELHRAGAGRGAPGARAAAEHVPLPRGTGQRPGGAVLAAADPSASPAASRPGSCPSPSTCSTCCSRTRRRATSRSRRR